MQCLWCAPCVPCGACGAYGPCVLCGTCGACSTCRRTVRAVRALCACPHVPHVPHVPFVHAVRARFARAVHALHACLRACTYVFVCRNTYITSTHVIMCIYTHIHNMQLVSPASRTLLLTPYNYYIGMFPSPGRALPRRPGARQSRGAERRGEAVEAGRSSQKQRHDTHLNNNKGF